MAKGEYGAVSYADDLTILANSEEMAMDVYRDLKKEFKDKCQLEFSSEKCEIFSTQPWNPEVNRENIPVKHKVKYLGITLRKSKTLMIRDWKEQVMRKVGKFSWRASKFEEQNRHYLMRVFVRAYMLFSAVPLYRAGLIEDAELTRIHDMALKKTFRLPTWVKKGMLDAIELDS
jgi:hypothetical protein